MAELSEDLLKFLGDCEKCFENRFSEEDTAFNDYVQTPQRGPPIEERWFARPPRNFDRNDRGGRRNDDRRGGGRDFEDRRGGRDFHDDRGSRDFHGGRDRDQQRYRDQRQNPYGRPNRGHQDRPRY